MTYPKLHPLELADIPTGSPLPFPVFDAHHTLLCCQGHVIENERALESLLEIGLFRYPDWQPHSCLPLLPNHNGFNHTEEPPANFEQIKLLPGATLHVRQTGDGLQPFEAVKLIGWVKDEDLLISATNQNGDPLQHKTGDLLEVKLLAGKGIITFKSEVKAVCDTDYLYSHLQYPEKIEYRKLRKNLRVDVGLPISASSNDDAICHEGHLSNLSACGGQLELNQLFASIGSEILLMLSLPAAGTEHSLVLHAKIRNLHTEELDGIPHVQYGLEFIETATSERLVLEHYIFQSLLDQSI